MTAENPAGLMPIDIGDTLPPLVLRNEKDEEFDVSTVAKTKGAIIFLVPKVNTGELSLPFFRLAGVSVQPLLVARSYQKFSSYPSISLHIST